MNKLCASTRASFASPPFATTNNNIPTAAPVTQWQHARHVVHLCGDGGSYCKGGVQNFFAAAAPVEREAEAEATALMFDSDHDDFFIDVDDDVEDNVDDDVDHDPEANKKRLRRDDGLK